MSRSTLRFCAKCADSFRDILGLVRYRLRSDKISCPGCGKKSICDEYSVTDVKKLRKRRR